MNSIEILQEKARNINDKTLMECLNHKKFKKHLHDYKNFHPVYKSMVEEAIERGLLTV